jgi:hypothetical protein
MCDLSDYLQNVVGPKKGDCTNPYVTAVGWGFNAVVCRKHYNMVELLFELRPGTLAPKLNANGTLINPHVPDFTYDALYLADYVKLLAVMQNRAAVMACMQALSQELSRTIVRQKQTPDDLDDRFKTLKKQARGYIRISRALSYYEQLCFFPSNHVVFSGALTGANFNWALTQGFMPKDPGAGSEHGDFSHRLQWHAVMRIATNGFSTPHFAAWNKSPLDLFTSLGSGPALNRNLWGVIFDAQGRPHFSDPSNLFKDVKSSPNLGPLQVEIDRSYNKRDKVQRECERILKEVFDRPALAAVKNYIEGRSVLAKPDRPIAANVVNTVYHWKKTSNPAAAAFTGTPHPAIPAYTVLGGFAAIPAPGPLYTQWETYFNSLTTLAAQVFWDRYILDNRSEFGKFLQGSRHTPYINESNGVAPVEGVIVADDYDRLWL